MNLWKLNFQSRSQSFKKNHITQYAPLRMIENWKTQLNEGNKIGVDLNKIMDLFKAFSTLNHNLLVAQNLKHTVLIQTLLRS